MENGDFFVVLHTTQKRIKCAKTAGFRVVKITRLGWYLFHMRYCCHPGRVHAEVQTEILVAMSAADPCLQVKPVSEMTDEEFGRMNDHVERAVARAKRR